MLNGSMSLLTSDDRLDVAPRVADRVGQNAAFFSVGDGCVGDQPLLAK